MMSANNKLDDFPDVEAKLQKPSKQSAFEKQKAEAEAKRKREAAETAAVYESFVKSFDNDDDDDGDPGVFDRRRNQASPPFGRGGNPLQFGTGGGLGKRHFGATSLKSGPGSLGPAPSTFGKKRYDSFQQGSGSKKLEEGRGRLGFHDDGNDGGMLPKPKGVSKAFDTSDDEADARSRDLAEEKAVARPTLRLVNLPPVTSPAVVKALIPTNLTVENVKILPLTNAGAGERKSMAAIVTLSTETPAADIDATVSSLQNRYLGYGFYLSLHRHLSSAVVSTTASTLTSASTSHAFGAKPVPQANDNDSYQPGGFHRGFAPPSSYNTGGGPMARTILHVPVRAPGDIKQIQLIHKVVESVLKHGPEFEALLMSRPDVQKEEKWAWIWDARSEGGVWYRWRLWEVVTGGPGGDGRQGKFLPLFEGSHAWKMPDKSLVYEYATGVDEFVSDPEYDSSDDEDLEDEGHKPTEGGDNGKAYLNPIDKAKLTHLLARLPTTLTKIRKGDIARLTSFAITHSSRGADEIVETIVSNIVRPFALTSANPGYSKTAGDDETRNQSLDSTPLPEDATGKSPEAQDTSAASLIGLYVISDILSSSATSGVRHAWRYRQLFETSLRRAKVFENLGLLAERLNWGRLRAEKWKRSVSLVLSLWEGWCAFPNDAQQLFTQTFENPPSAKKEELPEGPKKGGKWKPVETGLSVQHDSRGLHVPVDTGIEFKDAEAGFDDGLDGEAIDEDMDMDVELDSDIDGVPMDGDDDATALEQEVGIINGTDETNSVKQATTGETDVLPLPKQPHQPRRRMRAVDMFADSDTSDEGK
ncbi:putative coatamer subunit protein [Rosellinia necatrix]|uniref:Putative coatamer subunit protein n=1 Tax=Rosellinia necatrix TaxID=77044 RepID=A0A1W2TV12_ROSNE|nr:putative coatamer subunit protein [Rosellinia necatrix]